MKQNIIRNHFIDFFSTLGLWATKLMVTVHLVSGMTPFHGVDQRTVIGWLATHIRLALPLLQLILQSEKIAHPWFCDWVGVPIVPLKASPG